MKKQLIALQEYLAQNGLDAAYISTQDINYFTGFTATRRTYSCTSFSQTKTHLCCTTA